MRFKTWRSRKDTHLHVLCAEGSEAFESLPVAIRNLGPWTGGPEGEVDRLRLPYRVMLGEQGFAIIYAHVSELQLEAASMRAPARYCLGALQVNRGRARPAAAPEPDQVGSWAEVLGELALTATVLLGQSPRAPPSHPP